MTFLRKGSTLGNCHIVEGFLGKGGFGFVAKCHDTKTNITVAIKVHKSSAGIVREARQEILILKKLQSLDPETCNLVKWDGFFFHNEKFCLKFELLDQTLRDYMKDRKHKGLPMPELKPILHQLTTALSHLSSIGIVHADLKPDNVMVVNRHQHPLKVKLIDFGLASHVSAVRRGAGTTWYRAPEVMVLSDYNEAADMWSLGLTAVELATGVILYPGKTAYDVLRYIIHTQGQPADHVLDRGTHTFHYFQHQLCSEQRWKLKSEEQFQFDTGIQPTETRSIKLKVLDDLEQILEMRTGHHSDQRMFVNLIKRMLHLDPEERIRPQEVLQHPFFGPDLSPSSHRDPCTVTNNTDINLEVSQQPPSCQIRRAMNSDCCVQDGVTDIPSSWEPSCGEVNVQSKTNNVRSLRTIFRRITDVFCYCFSKLKRSWSSH